MAIDSAAIYDQHVVKSALFGKSKRQPYHHYDPDLSPRDQYDDHREIYSTINARPLNYTHFRNDITDPRYQAVSEQHGRREVGFTLGGAVAGGLLGSVGGVAALAATRAGRLPIDVGVNVAAAAPFLGAGLGAHAGRQLSGAPRHMQPAWETAVRRNKPTAEGGPGVPHVDPRLHLASDDPAERAYGEYMLRADRPAAQEDYERGMKDPVYRAVEEQSLANESKNRADQAFANVIGASTGAVAGLGAMAAAPMPPAARLAVGVAAPILGGVAANAFAKRRALPVPDRDEALDHAIARNRKA